MHNLWTIKSIKMKQSDRNKIVVSTHSGPTEKAKCHFTEEEFELTPGHAAYTFNSKFVSPRWAQSKGYEISSDLELPNTVKSRSELAEWLTGTLELDRNSKEFGLLYKTFGSALPAGYPTDGKF